jgi:hypothetical protein
VVSVRLALIVVTIAALAWRCDPPRVACCCAYCHGRGCGGWCRWCR